MRASQRGNTPPPSNNAPRARTPPPTSTSRVGGRTPPRSRQVEGDNDTEIREFLEGLLEGFRAAAAANAAQGNSGPRQPKWFEAEGNRGGKWTDLDDLEKTFPEIGGSLESYRDKLQDAKQSVTPTKGMSPRGNTGTGALGQTDSLTPRGQTVNFATDPLSVMMRRNALRGFLEETCGSVAKAFEQMASLAVKNSLGSQGGVGLPEQRMKYKFSPSEFQKTLSNMGYGVGAGQDWWRALFKSIDIDEDGAVSLQDMYDALVLDLPISQGQPGASSVFYSTADGPRSNRGDVSPGQTQRTLSPSKGGPLFDTIDANKDGYLSRAEFDNARRTGLLNDNCVVCGEAYASSTMFCRNCGTKRSD